MGKGRARCTDMYFVSFLCGWAHNACVHNSAREDAEQSAGSYCAMKYALIALNIQSETQQRGPLCQFL